MNNALEKGRHDEIIALVNKLLELSKKRQTTDTSKRELLDREAKVYEEKIDSLVYEIYSLTPEERKIVEEAVK